MTGIEQLNVILRAAIGCINRVDKLIQVRAVNANTISLAAGYDGYAYATAPTINGYSPILVTPRNAGASDICWIDCYFSNTYEITIKLKNTTTSARNNITPTVCVLYIKS